MRFNSRTLLAAVMLLVLCVTASFAQTSRGTVSGTVTDNSGAVVGNATVVLIDTATNVRRETKSNGEGIYRFDAVNLGEYKIEVEAAGFSKASVSKIAVSAGRTHDVPVSLRPGSTAETVTVEATGEQALQATEQVRVASISARKVADLPIVGQNSLNLMLTAPGVATTDQGGSTNSGIGAVNGSRPRSNSFLIDGVENNDISVNGPAFVPTNNDAIQEVSVQTSNFSAEFGRAGGAVVNQVTKSGTNALHGTATWVYKTQNFNAWTRAERNSGSQGVFLEHIPAFTVGGPVVIPGLYNGKDKSFFFAGAQWDRQNNGSLLSAPFRIPTAAGAATLNALATAGCTQARLYLDYLQGLVAPATNIANVSLAVPAAAFTAQGSCNGTARTGINLETGIVSRAVPSLFLDNNHTVRFDQKINDNQQFSARWLYDNQAQNNGGTIAVAPTGDADFTGKTMGIALTHTWVLNPTTTNEFRFNYGRIAFNFPLSSSSALVNTPVITFAGSSAMTGIGPAATFPQGRTANNWQYQDTVSKVVGSHQLRFGVDILRQLARQTAPATVRGTLAYAIATGVTGFANFLDNFSGNSANPIANGFGTPTYRPNLFRHAYFFEDSWRVKSNLTLNLGMRYENFGQPANIFNYPVVTTVASEFGTPSKVKQDNNNFGPTIGFAWTPRMFESIFGSDKTVIRGGFQVSYDTFFNNLLSNMAAGNPNFVTNLPIPATINATTPRGIANLSGLLPGLAPAPLNPLTNAASQFSKNIVNPYTMRFSLGIQRELPGKMIMDVSYVGSQTRKQFRTVQLNPIQPNAANTSTGVRANTTIGGRTPRISNASSNYNGLQAELRRGFSDTPIGGLTFSTNYTWSKNLSMVDEVFATNANPGTQGSSQRLILTNPRLDYGNSDLDVRHSFQTTAVWDIRGPKGQGFLGQTLGGWSLAFVIPIQSGFAFDVVNGFDRDWDGGTADRPDIGNMNAPITSRAIAVTAATCSTGFLNIDTNGCVNRNDVHWIAYGAVDLGGGLGTRKDPDANTALRNSVRTPGSILVNMNVIKKFSITERWKLEYRAEIFNLANHENFNYAPNGFTVGASLASVQGGTAAPFLDYASGRPLGDRTSNARNMRMGLKIIF